MPTGAKIEIEDPGDTEGCDSGAESSSVTRRAALGMTAAMTAGLLADRAVVRHRTCRRSFERKR